MARGARRSRKHVMRNILIRRAAAVWRGKRHGCGSGVAWRAAKHQHAQHIACNNSEENRSSDKGGVTAISKEENAV